MGHGSNNPRQTLGGNPNQKFDHPFQVRGDMTPGAQYEGGNGENNYDVLSLIAEEWIKLNPDATSLARGDSANELKLTGSRWQKIQTIVNWIAKENKLVDKNGNLCDGVKFKSPVIHQKLVLDLPMRGTGNTVKVVNPVQGTDCGGREGVCLAKKTVIVPEPYVQPKTIPVPVFQAPAPVPVPPPAPEPEPHYTARQSARASEGAHIRPGSVQWALETRAMLGDLGDDLSFAKDHWSLKNITPNKRARREKQSSETEHFNLDGDQKGKNRLSRKDDKTMDDTFRQNGKNRRLTDKGRSFTNGYVEEIDENGVMTRSDDVHSAWVHGGNYAIARKLGVINVGYMNVPVGAAIFKPSKQFPIFSETARYGLTQSHAAISEVNLGGKHAMVADQRSWITNPMETPDRINADTVMKADQRELEKQLSNVEKAGTAEEKKTAAIAALVALRDIKDNPVMKAADARSNGPLAESEKAIKQFLTDQKLDVATLSKEVADLTKHPRFVPSVMSATERQAIIDSGVPSSRLSGVKPDQADNPAMKKLVSSVFTVQNSVELQIAKGNSVKLTETQAITTASKTLQKIAENTDAAQSYGALLGHNQSAAIEYGQALHDILRNPENYALPQSVRENPKKYGLSEKEVKKGVFTEEASVKWVQELLGDTRKEPKDRDKTQPDDREKKKIAVGEAAFDDVYRNGRTPRAPWLRNKPVPVSRPELIGQAAEAQILENPKLFQDFVEVVTTQVTDKKTGLNDGRRYALGLVHALGGERASEKTGTRENRHPLHLAFITEALGIKGDPKNSETWKNEFLAGVRDVTAYTESGAAGYSVNASVRLDNELVKAQNDARKGKVDLNSTFNNLFTSQDARNVGSDKLAVEALKAHPGLARDVVLATMLRDPNALKGVEDHLQTLNKSLKRKLHEYDTLRDMVIDTRKLAEKYQKASGGDKVKAEKALTKAVEEFGAYFATMEEDVDRAEKLDAKGDRNSDSKRERRQEAKGQRQSQPAHNQAAQKAHAWSALMDGIGGNDAMSAAMVTTMGKHTALRDAFLASTKDAVFLDNQTIGHMPGTKGTHSHGDAVYQSAFFTMPTGKDGLVDTHSGFLGLKHNEVKPNVSFIQAVLKGNNDVAQSAALYVPPVAAAAPVIPENVALLRAKMATAKVDDAVIAKVYAIIDSGELDRLGKFSTTATDKLLGLTQALASADSSLAGGETPDAKSTLYKAVKALADQKLIGVQDGAVSMVTPESKGKTKAQPARVQEFAVTVSLVVAKAREESNAFKAVIGSPYAAQIAAGAEGRSENVKLLMGTIVSGGMLNNLSVAEAVKPGEAALENTAIVDQLVANHPEALKGVKRTDMMSAVEGLRKAGILTVANTGSAMTVAQAAPQAVQQGGGVDLKAVSVTSGIHHVLIGHHGGLEQALNAKTKDGKAVYAPAEHGQVRALIGAILEKETQAGGFVGTLGGLNPESRAIAIAKAIADKDEKQFGKKGKLNENSPLVKAVQAMLDAGMLVAGKDGKFAVKGVALTAEQELAAKELAAAMQASGVTEGNALGTNPAIYLGKAPEGASAADMQAKAKEQLGALLAEQAKTNPLLKGKLDSKEAIGAAVEQLLGSGAIQFANQGGALVAVPNQEGVGAVLATDGKLNVGVGVDTRVLLLALTPLVPKFVPIPINPVGPKVIPPHLSPDHLSKANDLMLSTIDKVTRGR